MRSLVDYKRIVSYIYQYNHQLKGNNIGFARIETRNKQCKFTIHVRVPSVSDQVVKAYIYCWMNGAMRGVLLGEVRLSNGVGEYQVVTEVDNLFSSRYTLSEMGGILLYISDACFLGTEWDDHAIVFDTLEIDTVKPANFGLRAEAKKQGQEEVKEIAATTQTLAKTPEVKKEENPENKSQFKIESREADFRFADVKGDPLERLEREVHKEVERTVENDLAEESDYVQAADVLQDSNDSFPLDKEKIDSLDKQAQQLFGSMLMNHLFPDDKEESKESETEAVEDLAEQVVVQNKVSIDPRTALEYFTSFKSCESEEEYKEIQEEISRCKTQVGQLENISNAWIDKMTREREEAKVRELEKQEMEAKIREELKIGQGIYEDIQPESVLEEQSVGAVLEKPTEEKTPVQNGVVARIFEKYPIITPFDDEVIQKCIRIEPQDIGIFPMENWILANNSFLLHGYYSYRHLIFAQYENNGTYEYFLGVPGIDYNRERFMAKMFGFDRFKSIHVGEQENQGAFGYWCFPIRM